MTSTSPLSTKNLSIGYPGKVLLEGLDLSLKTGSLVCFMGPNGVGKSTLIRTLAGLQKPLGGKVLIDPPVNNAIAVVLTDKISLHHMTVTDLVTLGRYPFLNWNVQLNTRESA